MNWRRIPTLKNRCVVGGNHLEIAVPVARTRSPKEKHKLVVEENSGRDLCHYLKNIRKRKIELTEIST